MICKYCGKNECIDGLKYCVECKEWHRKFNLERKNKLKQSGLCVVCGSRPALDNLVHCEICHAKNIDKSRADAIRRKKNNLCNRCHRNKCESGRICEDCKPIVRRTARESQRRRIVERSARGVCSDCQKETPDPSGMGRCLECHCKQLVKLTHLKGASWESLVDLWNAQSGRCALSGIEMSLADAEVDHIHPVANGGDAEISNLRWILKPINRMKRDMSDERLVELCKAIVQHMENRHG